MRINEDKQNIIYQIEDYNVMIDGKFFFDQPIKNDIKACVNIRKITTA